MGRIFAVVAAMLMSTGCHILRKDPPPRGDVAVGCKAADGFTVVTYNAGLAPGIVQYTSERTPLVAEALASEKGVDVLCLQEVWEEDAKRLIAGRLGLPPGQVVWADTAGENETGEDVCTQSEISGMASCINDDCAGLRDEDVALCAVAHCRLQGIAMYLGARHCLNCLIANAGHSIEETERVCVKEGGASRLYHGQNGIVLASKHPLRNVEVLRLRASGANRVALFATVDGPSGVPVEVACSHLSSKTYTSPTHPDFSSWDEEQGAQITEISARLAARAAGGPAIFAGDMNVGMRRGPNGDHMRRNWDLLMRLGYDSPAADAERPFCTSCADDQLRGRDDSYLIDHVLVRRDGRPALEPVCAARLFDDEVPVRSPSGGTVTTRRSDHYGLKVVLRPR